MPKVSREQAVKMRTKLQKQARSEIAKKEVMQFRLEPDAIEQLYDMAGKRRKPVGTLIREWIMERLQAETAGGATTEQRLSRVEEQITKLTKKLGA
jgi:hypothetical protein